MSRTRWRLVLVSGTAACALVALVQAGSGDLAGPPLRSWAAAEAWYEHTGPSTAAVALLRLVALAGAGWVLLATALQLFATLGRGRALPAIVDRVSPPVVRRLAHGVAGLTVTVGLVGPVAPTLDPDPPGTAVMEVLDHEPSTTEPPTAARPAARASAVPLAVPPPDEVRVAPGDSFWSIAADAVADHPAAPAVDAYWRVLVAANRARLVDPANPDLLFPGQVLTLPILEG